VRPRSRRPGTTAAQINADLAGLLAAVTTPGPLVWVMRPATAYRIAATIGGTAAVNVPLSLFGIPLVLSANSPAQVTLLDPSAILYSDDGRIEIESTDQAALQMDGAPTDPAVAATVFSRSGRTTSGRSRSRAGSPTYARKRAAWPT
jgi:hypothetical protein